MDPEIVKALTLLDALRRPVTVMRLGGQSTLCRLALQAGGAVISWLPHRRTA
jgi:hypothetical protein